VPRSIGVALSSGKATLHELDTVYGLEDLYSIIEVDTIDMHNRRRIRRMSDRKRGQ